MLRTQQCALPLTGNLELTVTDSKPPLKACLGVDLSSPKDRVVKPSSRKMSSYNSVLQYGLVSLFYHNIYQSGAIPVSCLVKAVRLQKTVPSPIAFTMF